MSNMDTRPAQGKAQLESLNGEITPERWEKIKELLLKVQPLEESAREALLQSACGSDRALRDEVESLVAVDAGSLETRLSPTVVLKAACFGSSADDPNIGSRVGAYKLVERIGDGGMAVVYRAARADDAYHKQVAVKVVRRELESADVLVRFHNERETLASLDHPNIVRLIDGGSTREGLPYLVMDYVEGTPIDQYCDRNKLTIDDRLRLFCAVCSAAHYAHQHLVVHRDLKPSNILVTKDGVPKLLDFGIAKVLDANSSARLASVTETDTRRMTPAYASPEQVRGEPVTPASDIYSLGVVLYELLTGHRPYKLKRHTPAEIEKEICEQEPQNPSIAIDRVETETGLEGATVSKTPELVSETREGEPERLRRRLRGDVDNIVLMALNKEPSRRYPSVDEFCQDVRRHLGHLPVKAQPSTLGYRTVKFVRRHRLEVIVASLFLLVLLGAAGFSIWEEHRLAERARLELIGQRSQGRRSIAVLGFRNLSRKKDTQWLSTALSEMLTTELSAGGSVRTIPEEIIAEAGFDLSLPNTDAVTKKTLSRIYKTLGSDYVVRGSYLDLGDTNRSVRLDLELQDAALGETIAVVAENGTEAALPQLAIQAGSDLRAKLRLNGVTESDRSAFQATFPSNVEAARFYAEGVARLRVFDAPAARGELENAITAEPTFALAHAALSECWSELGYDAKAEMEAKQAFDLSSKLSREDRLWIEGHYRETTHDWSRAIQVYSALFEFFPDNLDYGLRLISTRIKANQTQDLTSIVDALRRLPVPLRDDPRIDLADAKACNEKQRTRALAAISRAWAKASALGEILLMARVRMEQGEALRSSADFREALPFLSDAHDLFARAGDQNGAAAAQNSIAIINDFLGRPLEAEKAFKSALATYQLSGNQRGQASEMNDIGNVMDSMGDRAGAERMFGTSLAIYRKLGDKHGEADVLNNLAFALDDEGDLVGSRATFEQSLQIYRQFNLTGGIAMGLLNTGFVRLEQGELLDAKQRCMDSLKILRPLADKHLLPHALSTLGEIEMAQGDLRSAEKNFEVASQMRKETGEDAEAESQLDLSLIAIEMGRFDDAVSLATKAAGRFRDANAVETELYANAVLARALAAKGQFAASQIVIDHVLTKSDKPLAMEGRNLAAVITAGRARAEASHYANPADIAEAERILSIALTVATNHGYLGYVLAARLALIEIALKSRGVLPAQDELASLEREARSKGFGLIANKAAALRRRESLPRPHIDGTLALQHADVR
jgi:serine/threonine protein kinase/tetratricopeptide (TPR) repeat protein